MKLGLGTVQFGMSYGISNSYGRPDQKEVKKILDLACKNQIRCLDTASLYGGSEEVLGECLSKDHGFEIVTKTPQFKVAAVTAKECDQVSETFCRSLEKLRQESLYGIMIHRAEDLFAKGGERLLSCLAGLKRQGLVRKVGVSVYEAQEIDRILEMGSIDLIQLPVNLLDQRLVQSGHLKRLKKAGVEIHARSVFLQGLLLMSTSELPPTFDSVKQHLAQVQVRSTRDGLSMLETALGFVLSMEEIDRVLVGVSQQVELLEILKVLESVKSRFSEIRRIASAAAWSDERILNPAQWEKYA